MGHTRHWWVLRIELVIGLAAVGLGVLAYRTMPGDMLTEPSPQGNPILLAGLAGLAAGLIWMFRVFRGPKDQAPT
jgi:hypothetical protein